MKMLKNIFKSLLIAGVCLPLGIIQSYAAPSADEIRFEKEYEQQLKREENLKKSRPEIYDNLKRSANEARLKAYQKVIESRGEQAQAINAINPPECKYYSTEGLYTLPSTIIAPYPLIAHVNTALDFKFPRLLGNCTGEYVRVYPSPNGYSIRYSKPNVKADIYIYDMPFSMYKDEVLICQTLLETANTVRSINPNVIFDSKISLGNFTNGDKSKYFYFYMQYAENDFSYAMIFSKNRKFIKFRISQSGCNKVEFEKFVNAFIADFDKKVILDSQTRTRKFQNAVMYPIVMRENIDE